MISKNLKSFLLAPYCVLVSKPQLPLESTMRLSSGYHQIHLSTLYLLFIFYFIFHFFMTSFSGKFLLFLVFLYSALNFFDLASVSIRVDLCVYYLYVSVCISSGILLLISLPQPFFPG